MRYRSVVPTALSGEYSAALLSGRIRGTAGPAHTVRWGSGDADVDGEARADGRRPDTAGAVTDADVRYMNLAISHARIGIGNTYPNPAVGCVLVRRAAARADDDGEADADDAVIGSGFHPRSGLPHAEVFALMEACGHVESGIAAAKSVLSAASDENSGVATKVRDLLVTYSSPGGPALLFGDAFARGTNDSANADVTAYVTLEPCCHTGKTPPCAASLREAGVSRVVVGFRDPNPRVDGGGVKLLREAGVTVDLLQVSDDDDEGEDESRLVRAEGRSEAAAECANLVSSFAKRIAPRPDGPIDYGTAMNGAKRRALRKMANRLKSETKGGTEERGKLTVLGWPGDGQGVDASSKDDMGAAVAALPLNHKWMEEVDRILWEED